jgi:hypothetical protein
MLEWTHAGGGAWLMMIVYHDDSRREYAYGPAGGLPDTKVGMNIPDNSRLSRAGKSRLAKRTIIYGQRPVVRNINDNGGVASSSEYLREVGRHG